MTEGKGKRWKFWGSIGFSLASGWGQRKGDLRESIKQQSEQLKQLKQIEQIKLRKGKTK